MAAGDESTVTVLRVRSGDAVLLDRLRGGSSGSGSSGGSALSGRGSVHSVFVHAVNLLTPDHLLITLAARGSGDAPRTLVTDAPDLTAQGLAAGQHVTFAPAALTLGTPHRPLRLSTATARRWHAAAPPLDTLSPARLRAAADSLDRLTRAHGTPGGMLGPAADAGPMEAAVGRALAEGRALLVSAARAGRPAGIRSAILALLGLGPGLTPSGDDFLTALALLAALPGSALHTPFGRELRAVLRERAGHRTTPVSAAVLSEAADGRVHSELLELLRAVARTAGLAGDQLDRALEEPVRRMLAVGHTSGADTLSGLVTGLHLEKELRGQL